MIPNHQTRISQDGFKVSVKSVTRNVQDFDVDLNCAGTAQYAGGKDTPAAITSLSVHTSKRTANKAS